MRPQLNISGFEIIDFIGEGAFGVVYRARQVSTGQKVAIKVLRPGVLDSPSKIQKIRQFQRETILYAELRHPNIVQLIDRGSDASGLPLRIDT